MGTKSRESIYGASIRASAERAREVRKEADRLACEAWNARMWANTRHRDWRYKDRGRPTLRETNGTRVHTLDFALEDRETGHVFVAEMKCEIEYQNFKYLVLESDAQLEHHTKPAFEAFLQAARPSSDWKVFVNQGEIPIHGAILIWGDASKEGKAQVKNLRGFHEVLTIAEICNDLRKWECEKYRDFLEKRQRWCDEMFSGLLGPLRNTRDRTGPA
jgi:hypothetical protein